MFDLSILLQCKFVDLRAWSSMSSCPDQIKFLLDRQEKLHERQFELKALVESCRSSSGPGADNAAVSVDNWSRPFEWDSQADDIRFNVFGISKYRANQREVPLAAVHSVHSIDAYLYLYVVLLF
ncbi:Werner syndrome ATP-dependent helicase [Datura stramonium]|uniref:Werner syndrome ATP-dependent helicase n=1 Tax=Datura stramonium TaxID=4076 RepID=A0ABS8W091_DATST|nr:Werner syndrome ATP-dependent helicase [Datura stramonium]